MLKIGTMLFNINDINIMLVPYLFKNLIVSIFIILLIYLFNEFSSCIAFRFYVCVIYFIIQNLFNNIKYIRIIKQFSIVFQNRFKYYDWS